MYCSGMPLRTTAVDAAVARGWSKSELARRSGLSLSLIYQLDRGARPGAKAIAGLMQAFPDLPFERLFVPVDSSKLQRLSREAEAVVAA